MDRQHGPAAYQAAVTRGQYQFEDGLFFGGKAPTWSNFSVARGPAHAVQAARRLAWIDLHTGLGPNGLGERIFSCRDDKAAYARANAWWGTPAAPVTSIYDGSSTSAFLTGLMWNAIYEECPRAEYTGIALEYGTVPMMEVVGALRADHWLHKHPGSAARTRGHDPGEDAGGLLHRYRRLARSDHQPGAAGDVPGGGWAGRRGLRFRYGSGRRP